MTDWPRMIHSRDNRRLLIFGVMYICSGIGQIFTQPPTASPAYAGQLKLMSLTQWGVLFLAAGFAAIAAATTRRWTWLGYGILMAVTMGWGLLFLGSWFITGYSRALIGALPYLAMAVLLADLARYDAPTTVLQQAGAPEKTK